MPNGPLLTAVATAHREAADRLAAVGAAAADDRPSRLALLASVVHRTAHAEETVLFPTFRQAMGDEAALVETLTAEHGEIADRLDALIGHPTAGGFANAVAALARDLRDHQADEVDAMLPVLTETLGEDEAAALAAEFCQALDG